MSESERKTTESHPCNEHSGASYFTIRGRRMSKTESERVRVSSKVSI